MKVRRKERTPGVYAGVDDLLRFVCYLTGDGRKQASQLYPSAQHSVLERQTTHFTLQPHQVEHITYDFEATYIPHSTCYNTVFYCLPTNEFLMKIQVLLHSKVIGVRTTYT